MTAPWAPPPSDVLDTSLGTELDTELGALLDTLLGERVVSVDVERSPFSTSAPIDNLTVSVAGGARRRLVRKDVSWSSLLPEARVGKPAFLYDPRREMSMYSALLTFAPPGPPRCFGVVDEPEIGRQWLLLEQLDGIELFQVGDTEGWALAAQWAAGLHRAFADGSMHLAQVPLLVHDAPWLRRWSRRALAQSTPDTRPAVQHVHATCEALVERFVSMPTTLVHGEFYASNVIIDQRDGITRVSPVDWEMAALAPALIDVAALTAGRLDPAMRGAIERAYCAAAGRPYDAAFAHDLDVCRLALCVQWLGWMPDWSPPPDHAQDWLGEALCLVDRLDL